MNSLPPTARRAVAAATLTCVAMLAVGCGHSPDTSASPGKTITVTGAPPGHTPVVANTYVATPSASPVVPAGPGPCPTRSLRLKLGLSQGTAGSVYTVIDFTNISNVSCTLYGYPGVSLASGTPVTQIGQAAVENPATPRQLVTLPPGVTGNALLRIVDAQNYPTSRCGPVATGYLQIYPPNQTTPVYLRYKTQGCTKPVRLLTVDVVKPGSGGS
jgi:hypothetical protein